MAENTPRVLRRPAVEALTGLRGGSLDREMRLGFPRPFRLSADPRSRVVGWLASDVARWIEERAAEGQREAA